MSVTDPLAAAPLEMQPLIRGVANRLREEFAGAFGEETIQRFMADSWEKLDGAKVAAFIPLFVERFTRQRLRALARVEGKLADTPADGRLPVRPQRRTLADGGGLDAAPRR